MSTALEQGASSAGPLTPRRLLKMGVFTICVAAMLPLIVLAWIEKKVTQSEALFVGISHFLSLLPGFPGTQLRAAFYWAALEECSWEIHVGFGSIFTHRAASLAPRVSMGAYCVIGHVRIHTGVMMGSRVSIPSGKRQHFDASGGIVGTARFDTVEIGAGTWVGEAATIMANVGSHCVVSAGAVVTQEMPERCIVGGNPARVLKEMSPQTQESGS